MDKNIEKDEAKYWREQYESLCVEIQGYRLHAKLCPSHFKNTDPWVRESALVAKQKQSDAFEAAWKEELAVNAALRAELAGNK